MIPRIGHEQPAIRKDQPLRCRKSCRGGISIKKTFVLATVDLLDLDVDSLNTDLTNPDAPEKILAMKLNCLNSTTFTYAPGKESLCVIFWKLSDKNTASVASSEPNAPSPRPASAAAPVPMDIYYH